MKQYFIAEKQTESKTENNIRTERYEIKDFNASEVIISKIIEWAYDEFESDCEYAYYEYGISGGFDEELYSINVNKFIRLVGHNIESEKEEFGDEEDLELYENILKVLNDFKGYILYYKGEQTE
jgi:hypothetical protein